MNRACETWLARIGTESAFDRTERAGKDLAVGGLNLRILHRPADVIDLQNCVYTDLWQRILLVLLGLNTSFVCGEPQD